MSPEEMFGFTPESSELFAQTHFRAILNGTATYNYLVATLNQPSAKDVGKFVREMTDLQMPVDTAKIFQLGLVATGNFKIGSIPVGEITTHLLSGTTRVLAYATSEAVIHMALFGFVWNVRSLSGRPLFVQMYRHPVKEEGYSGNIAGIGEVKLFPRYSGIPQQQ